MEEGRFAGLYDSSFGLLLRRIHMSVARIAGRHKCRNIVDLGCGTGAQCITLHGKGFDVTGVDMSPKMLEVASKKSSPEIKYIRGGIEKTGFEDGSFDCAVISFVIHMNDAKNKKEIIREAKRIVRDGGIMVITDYGIPSTFKGKIAGLMVKIIENLAIEEHKKNYRRYMERGALNFLIEENNLSVAERHGFYSGAIETIVVKK